MLMYVTLSVLIQLQTHYCHQFALLLSNEMQQEKLSFSSHEESLKQRKLIKIKFNFFKLHIKQYVSNIIFHLIVIIPHLESINGKRKHF